LTTPLNFRLCDNIDVLLSVFHRHTHRGIPPRW
jgi:hypothetical protein